MISRFNSNPHSAAYECSDGVFVLYADYEALEAKLAVLVEVSEGCLSWLSSYPGEGAAKYYDKLKAAIEAAKETK